MKNLLLPLLAGGVLGPRTSPSSLPPGASCALAARDVCVVLRSDTLDYLPGARVNLRHGPHLDQLQTDAYGQTSTISVEDGENLSIEFEESLTSSDRGLGQVRAFDLASRGAGARGVTIHCLQPTLTSCTVSPGAEVYAAPFHDRWVLTAPASPDTFSIELAVGILLSAESTDEYLTYHGVPTGGQEPEMAVVLRSDGQILPKSGVWLTIDCRGTACDSATHRDLASLLICRPNAAPEDGLVSTLGGFESGRAQVLLTGRLGKGDNVILIGKLDLAKLPKQLATRKQSSSLPRSTSSGSACDVDAPKPPPEWDPDSHISKSLMAQSEGHAITELNEEQQVTTTRVGGVVCLSADETWKGGIISVYDGVSPILVRSSEGGGANINGAVQFATPVDTIGYQGEQHCRCHAAFIHESRKTATWEITRDLLVPSEDHKYILKSETAHHKIRSCSLEWFGSSANGCNCP